MLLDKPASARIRESAPCKSLKSQQTTGHQQPEDGADEIGVSLVTENRCGVQNNSEKFTLVSIWRSRGVQMGCDVAVASH